MYFEPRTADRDEKGVFGSSIVRQQVDGRGATDRGMDGWTARQTDAEIEARRLRREKVS